MTSPYIGLLGGEGRMPLLTIRGIHQKKKKVLLIAFKGITPNSLAEEADKVVWLHLTQIGGAIRALRKHGVVEVIMA